MADLFPVRPQRNLSSARRSVTALAAVAALACGGGGGADGAAGGPTFASTSCADASDGCAFVAAHDRVRATAQPAAAPPLAPLEWSAGVAQVARTWAQHCSWQHDPALSAQRLGQNLYASTFEPGTELVVASWASEAADYDRATNSCAAGKECGHYTQLVWRSTKQVGCAKVSCTTGSPFGQGTWWYVVCDYSPPGNIIGQPPY